MIPRRNPQRGTALLSTLLAIGFLVTIGALASTQARMSLLVRQRAQESLEALISADTAMARARANLAREPSFERFDLTEGSPFPYDAAPPVGPQPRSFAAEVRISRPSETRIDVESTSLGRKHAQRRLLLTLERDSAPFLPAAFYLTAANPTLMGNSDLILTGGSGEQSGVPALSSPGAQATATAATSLLASGATLTGSPVSASRRWSGLEAAIERLHANPHTELPALAGGSFTPAVRISRGSVEVADAQGAGVWLVDGPMAVRGGFDFEGLLIVAGDIRVEADADVEIRGCLIQAPPGNIVDASGGFRVRFDGAAIEEVDALSPDLLDRQVVVMGWRDDS